MKKTGATGPLQARIRWGEQQLKPSWGDDLWFCYGVLMCIL